MQVSSPVYLTVVPEDTAEHREAVVILDMQQPIPEWTVSFEQRAVLSM